jgi:hypothetical protein
MIGETLNPPSMKGMPFVIPFNFTSIAASTRNSVNVTSPHNLAVYAISIFNTIDPAALYYDYTLEILNYDIGSKLMDAPIQAYTIQSNCRTPWKLPCSWFVPRNTQLTIRLNTMLDPNASTFTAQVALLAFMTDTDPNPDRKPFIYSFPFNLGFQDLVTSTPITLAFDQYINGSNTKNMLKDFELKSIAIDSIGSQVLFTNTAPFLNFQVLSPDKGLKKLFNRPVSVGVAGGGLPATFSGTGSYALTYPSGYPTTNVFQYPLPVSESFKKGERIRVEVSLAPMYLSSNNIHDLNCHANVALIGNHLN